jgi:hypothetical protein
MPAASVQGDTHAGRVWMEERYGFAIDSVQAPSGVAEEPGIGRCDG